MADKCKLCNKYFQSDSGCNCRLSKKQRKKKKQLDKMQENTKTQSSPRPKTSYHIKDLRNIKALTPAQKDTFVSFSEGYNMMLHGVAGTGKTFLAIYIALRELLQTNSEYQQIVIVRSVVPTRDMGFLPGTENEKMAPYELPYTQIFGELLGRASAYETLKKKQSVNFITTSHIRGITISNSIVIVDEAQNMNFGELDSMITRIGENSKIIICGDLVQTDLSKSRYDECGLDKFMDILEGMKSFDHIEFYEEDIVRSGLVKEYLISKLKSK